ncbi:UDP-N-acetylmuramoyl-L-alanine--D-glutamate ligase [Leptotrichia sp. OH3620_COT-345]|uniref:UDP-N-acetylmuramoyl-L-alanine--D-glutamate ligase n=1 Tax=Leptotrichia sp. OH3620_COT-345 TaxID=2491048 RepID=UPI000F6495AE|nr:UDP-N-acetylmuramoyl-L-alanine--D-glutamate ligase [Leptotrichia sp. OH3620_COT-345]RRD38419.1 UDP-N-acetylmuramoyl-L-alanine--D-glutamate ligase [Leptotrichia sp. OH3620_COT-345]
MSKAMVFGKGLSGMGAKELLEKKEYEVFLIDDNGGIPSSEGIDLLNRENIDFIVKSPGISWKAELLQKASEKKVKVISEIDLAYRYMDKNTKIISFTGTNGKTTTCTKMYELLKYAGYNVKLAGNAGYSFAKLVADEEILDYIVLELSSYQLENNPQVHSHIAGIINLTPDHLTRYKSVEDYYITKFNIFEKQDKNDFALINLDDEQFEKINNIKDINEKIKAQKMFLSTEKKGTVFVHEDNIYIMKNLNERIEFHRDENVDKVAEKLMHIKEIALKGKHNLENMLFLIGAAKILDISNEKIIQFLKNTKSLEHRLENFFIKEKTTFINDSKGTNVESTLKAIDSFESSLILICGGDDKKISNDELIKKIKEKIDFVYLIGENAPLLEKELQAVRYLKYSNMETVENILKYLKENMDFSKEQVVLFSPATSSFCQFKNFEHRGKVFKELTEKILG